MEQNLPTMAERFRREGYTTGLVFDTPMFMTQGNFLDRGFGSISWIRGQGGEPWISDELQEIKWPASEDKVKSGVMRYLANQRGRLFESDYLGPRVFTEAMHWLERNYVKDGVFSVDRFVGSARAVGPATVIMWICTIRVMKAMSLFIRVMGSAII